MAFVIVASALLAGGALYYLQVYAFYEEVSLPQGREIALTPLGSGAPQFIPVEEVRAIDAASSPLRFRACFTTALTPSELSASFRPYPQAEPLIAPGWFECFDAKAIGAALERGEARAFLGQAAIRKEVDQVVAILPDGRGYAWHQLIPEAE